MAQLVTPEEVLKAQGSASTTRLVICVAVVFLHGMMCGASLGYGGLVLPHHLHPESSSGLLNLDQGQASWFNSVTPVGMCLGVLASIPASERLGRKKMFLISNVVSCLGFVCIYLAPSYLFLVAFRIGQCFGLGLGATTTAVFLTEVGIVRLRGPVSGCNMTSFCFGLLCYTAISPLVPVSLLAIVLALHCLVVFLLILLLLPDSPQWLVRRGKEEDARAALKRLRGSR